MVCKNSLSRTGRQAHKPLCVSQRGLVEKTEICSYFLTLAAFFGALLGFRAEADGDDPR